VAEIGSKSFGGGGLQVFWKVREPTLRVATTGDETRRWRGYVAVPGARREAPNSDILPKRHLIDSKASTLRGVSKDWLLAVQKKWERLRPRFLYLVECKRFAPERPVGVGLARLLSGIVEAERAPTLYEWRDRASD
jgi:hypothetical protein